MPKKNVKYVCPPKSCPAPADFKGFPELQALVRKEWAARITYNRNRKDKNESNIS